ncbi:hypothetical protein EDB84DRAFT_1567923 [Lactarius hengduanensis]|nr:hypothetical protein EDB84DRAFT_1567923 [Lactarius hengduanensis]
MPLLGRLDNKEHDDVKKIAHSPNGRRSSSVELDVTLPENVETSVQASMDVCDPLDAGQREGEFESLAQHESEEDLTNVNEEPCLGGSASLASEERHELSPMRAEGVRKDEATDDNHNDNIASPSRTIYQPPAPYQRKYQTQRRRHPNN